MPHFGPGTSVLTCESTSSPRSTRPRSTAAPECMSPSWSRPCASGMDVQVRAFGSRARRGRNDRVRRARRAGCRERRDPDPRHRPRDRDGCRRRRRRAQPHLVRELRRAPRLAAARHPAHRDRAQPRAAAAVEGRAARRRLRRVELHREDRIRGCGGDRRGQRGDARRHPAQLPDARSRRRCA